MVACNTTSSVVLPRLKHLVQLPVVGMLEGVSQAAAAAGKRRIGVLATEATVRSGVYARTLEEALPGAEVLMQSAPELVPLVEAGEIAGPKVRAALLRYLDPVDPGD